MTSTTDTAGHPDVAEISDLTEGLLPPSRTADVRRHLDGCALCADVYASLEEIRGLLGTLPGPPRMPADIAGRIDAALAAEALLNATAPERDDRRRSLPQCHAVTDSGHDGRRMFHVKHRLPVADRPRGRRPTRAPPPARAARPRRAGTSADRSPRRRRSRPPRWALGGLAVQSLGHRRLGA